MKKAEMGIGSFIFIITVLLISAVAAGIIIHTEGAFQEQVLSTGKSTAKELATGFNVIEIKASDGRTGKLTDFCALVRPSIGSEAILIDDVGISFNTKTSSVYLIFRGLAYGLKYDAFDGYYSWSKDIANSTMKRQLGEINSTINHYALEDDINLDEMQDYAYVNSQGTGLVFNLSGETDLALVSFNGADISEASIAPLGVEINILDEPILLDSKIYGYVSISGKTYTNYTLEESMNVTLKLPFPNPDNLELGNGYFTVKYERTGLEHKLGVIRPDELVKICFQPPNIIREDELVMIRITPKTGTPSVLEFYTPPVISDKEIFLYPT